MFLSLCGNRDTVIGVSGALSVVEISTIRSSVRRKKEKRRFTYTRFESIETHQALRYSDTSANVRTQPQERAVQGQKSTLASRRTTRGEIRIPRIHRQSPQRVIGFGPL